MDQCFLLEPEILFYSTMPPEAAVDDDDEETCRRSVEAQGNETQEQLPDESQARNDDD